MCQEHFGYYVIQSSKHVYKGGIISFNQCLASGGGSLSPQRLKGPHSHCIGDVYTECSRISPQSKGCEGTGLALCNFLPQVLLLSQLQREESNKEMSIDCFSCSKVKVTTSPLKMRAEMGFKSKETDGLLSPPIMSLRLTITGHLDST